MSKRNKLIVVKVNTKTRNAVLITIDKKPEAIMQIVGERRLVGRDIKLEDGKILRLVCHGNPPEDAVRWTFGGSGFATLGGWVRGDAVFTGFDPLLSASGEPGVISVPVDAKFILDRIHWFDPAVDSIGEADGDEKVEG